MRILIAVPTFENIMPDTFKAIYDLDTTGHEVQFEFVRGYDCATARNHIVQMALDKDVDYVLMSLLPDIDDPVIRAKQHRGIASSIDDLDNDSNDEWYTLTGTKLNGRPVQRGVYIHNGKKVSVK